CGDYDSVIGMQKGPAVRKFVTKMPGERPQVAEGEATLCGILLETDDKTGVALSVEPVRIGGRLAPHLPQRRGFELPAPSPLRDRVGISRGTQIAGSIEATLLAVLVYTGGITIELLFALTLLLGVFNAVAQPSRLALIPTLVDRAALPSALAINAIIFNSA